MIVITVRERGDRPGLYDARCDGRYLVTSTCPFIDGCRVLLAWGYDPEANVVMRHIGSDTAALRGRIGVVASVEINGHGTGFRRARAGAKAPSVHFNDPPATLGARKAA